MSISIHALPASTSITHASAWVDTEGGAQLRCCLRNSRAGERVRRGAVTPPGPQGAYAETGPVFVHADGCQGPESPGYPDDFRSRQVVFRAYDRSGQIVGGEIVEPGALVQLRYEGDDDADTYFYGSVEERGVEHDIISPGSPLGEALLGKKVGDKVEFVSPTGATLRVEVVSIS